MCNLSEAILEEGIEKGLEKGLKEGLKEGRQEGRQEGLEEGRILQLYELVHTKTITLEQASKSLSMTTDQFTSKLKSLGLL